MSEASTGAHPGDFDVSRRGYERAAVDRWVAEATGRIEALQRDRDALAAQLASLGMKDSVDLQAEIEAIGGEVARILQAARSAADGMRTRAAEDAAEWQAKARAEAAATRASTTADAESMRGSAWDASIELLDKVRAEAEAQVRTARQEVLLVRAEAEQDAHRLVAGARRDMEEEARASRLEAERTLAAAKAESEKMIESARLEAEAAQERAAALEQRRSELMADLEEARGAIAALETDLEARRESLKLGFSEEVAESTTVRVIDPSTPAEAWTAGETGVRLLPGGKPGPPAPVDADAMAAEVRQMRESTATPPAPEPIVEPSVAKEPVAVSEPLPTTAEPATEVAEPVADAEPVAPSKPEPTSAEAESGAAVAGSEPPGAPDAELAPTEMASVPSARAVELPPPEAAIEEAADEPIVPNPLPAEAGSGSMPLHVEPPSAEVDVAEPAGASPPASEPGGLDTLFARLRSGPGDRPANGVRPPNGDEPAPGPLPTSTKAPSAEATPEPQPAAEDAAATDADAFELRDRMLLPLTNRALRETKRVILDLQNGALEELRVEGDAWRPQAGSYQQALHEALSTLGGESHLAGVEAAAELTGLAVAVEEPQQQIPAEAIIGMALADAVAAVVERAAGSGAGQRSTSAAVSRVFRAWRSDEAERRLRSMSYGAYHAGLLAALAAAGVPRVVGQPAGIPCAECPAGTGEAWDPAGTPPQGTVVPPALVECGCTVVPAGR